MNKKGFSLIELLAVVVLLGILSTVAVAGVSRYLEKSKIEAFNTMRLSACDAIQNKILQQKFVCNIPAAEADRKTSANNCYFKLEDLVKEQYLEPLSDPTNKGNTCWGFVYVNSIDTNSMVNQYDVRVVLECAGYKTKSDSDETKNSQMCSNLKTRNFKKN